MHEASEKSVEQALLEHMKLKLSRQTVYNQLDTFDELICHLPKGVITPKIQETTDRYLSEANNIINDIEAESEQLHLRLKPFLTL